MEFLEVFFPVSGVATHIVVPPLVAFVIAFFASMGGLSGAFLILPFQMSVLGFISPAVTATNFVYNVVAIPGGVAGYARAGRMNWPLMWTITAGTLPGMLIGYYVRVTYLPEPGRFRVFVGLVLLYLALKLVLELIKGRGTAEKIPAGSKMPALATVSAGPGRVVYRFGTEEYSFRTLTVAALSFAVGIVGGAYGIGGGAIIAPFLVAGLGLHVYTIAGATLASTFAASIAGVVFYSTLPSAVQSRPDWALGALFGAGGFAGMYLGARVQGLVPQRIIKAIIAALFGAIAVKYIFL